MTLSAAIDSGIGLTAGKKLVGKAIPQSDDTYLTTVKLRKKFIQLKKFHTIQPKQTVETETIESLKSDVVKLQEELTQQKRITDTIAEENLKIKQELGRIQPVIDFVNTYNRENEHQKMLELVKAEAEFDQVPYDPKLRAYHFDETIEKQMNEISEKEGISKAEAMAKIADKHWANFLENDKKMMKHLKERGIPITEEDYKKQLEAAIEKNKRMNAKYQRRLDRIKNRKD
jgi:hypothetical protein